MTCNISAVGGLLLQCLAGFGNQPSILDRNDGLVSKSADRSIWRSVNGPARWRHSAKTPIGSPARNSGTPNSARILPISATSGLHIRGRQ